MVKKAIILLADGFEEIEALTCADVLIRGGIDCKMCSVNHSKYVKGAHGIVIQADIILENTNEDEYHALILPGGMPGATNLRNNERVIETIVKFQRENKIIAAICAAPIVLKKAEIIHNKKVTSYPGFEEEIQPCNYSEEIVVQDGNIITSRGPATAFYFAFKILENLTHKDNVEQLKNDMLFFEHN